MSPVRVTASRTLGMARNLFSTAVAVGGFLAAVAALFSFNLSAAEGGDLPLIAVWAISAAPALPVLAAFLAMDTWSEERRSGRLDVLLATAVRERDLVLGKFLGVWFLTVGSAVVSLLSSLSFLWVFAPNALAGVQAISIVPALMGVMLQSALWCAVGVATSTLFSNAAASICTSLALTVALPRGLWAGLMAWSREGRAAFGEMPLDAHALDMATGVFSLGTVALHVVGVVLCLFIASKFVAANRLSGRGARTLRLSTGVAVGLALVAGALFAALAVRLDAVLDLPVLSASVPLSPRTRDILAESSGDISVTCFLPRDDARFRSVSRLVRNLRRVAESVGGARFVVSYVDPRWDIGAAERLVGRGVAEESLVFEKGRRTVSVSLRDGGGERACAAAIRRLATVPRRRNVYWTIGHGECRFDDYGAFGMSDVARDLSQAGYCNRPLDLAVAQQIPGDCALIVIAGAKSAFSRVELGRLDAYLRAGGRLFALMGSADELGIAALLPAWGVRPEAVPIVGVPTLSGSDVIVSDFADHPVSAPLKGSRLVLDRPIAFSPSVAAEAGTGTGADRIEYAAIASVGSRALAVAIERGAGAGADLAIRPTRLVVVGDTSFALNGSLVSRANANRDFFLNCAAYLAGTDVAGASGNETDRLVVGLDRAGRRRHVLWSAIILPGVVFLLLAGEAFRRRRRT